jgi:hypothetical protein
MYSTDAKIQKRPKQLGIKKFENHGAAGYAANDQRDIAGSYSGK